MALTPHADPARPGDRAARSRGVLVGFLGAIVRPLGGWMPIGATVELLAQVGVDESSVRTGVSRLKQRGWLAPETRAGTRGYALTDQATEALHAGDEVVWHARRPSDLADGWCIVHFSVPESARARRTRLRSRLTALGFGNVGSAMWIAPARMLEEGRRAIAELELTGQCALFVGDYAGGLELERLARESWDLTAINAGYQGFLARYGGAEAQLRRLASVGGAQAFAAYLAVIEDWRPLPFRDPGLPSELLGREWVAADAGGLFERLVALLERPALDHAARAWPAQAI
jgi:phenylacetic acid degradation operon negative regulatory protein